ALFERFGMYATGVEPAAGAAWWGVTMSGVAPTEMAPFLDQNGPAGVVDRMFGTDGFIGRYAYLDAGTDLDLSYNAGLAIFADSPLDIAAPLRYHGTHWAFGPGSPGFMNYSCRPSWPDNPFPNYATSPPIPMSGPPGPADFSFDVPA